VRNGEGDSNRVYTACAGQACSSLKERTCAEVKYIADTLSEVGGVGAEQKGRERRCSKDRADRGVA
jgi:hypothetical protein